MSGTVHPLQDDQRKAVDPLETVWLSASAGTGKTQVLSARVLRLLLQKDVDPSQILCLTFTKAGAAEMAVRVNEVLARWVRLDEAALGTELRAIGAPMDPQTRGRARTLFASVLDCPGGGLRIDTIHAFAQWLLSAFPSEAGLTPGTRAMEDRERDLLSREVLAEMLVRAERENDQDVLGAIADLSLKKGPDAVEAWLMRCAQAREAWFGPGKWMPPLKPRLFQLLGLNADAGEGDVARLCGDDAFDVQSLRQCMEINRAWSAKTGQANAAAISAWLAASPAARADGVEDLYQLFHTGKGDLRASSSQQKIDPAYADYVVRAAQSIAHVRELKAMLDLAAWLAPALALGRKFALAWDEAKKREAYIDFDDQIRAAANLLNRSDLAEWIRYKLDRRFDHILVDEAQDTNEAQWQIIGALTGDFFAGQGQHDDKMRTLFVVGDYKQAIFRFQGTSPKNFARARDRVGQAMAGALRNAQEARTRVTARELRALGLGRSFRTANVVLDFVDSAITAIGHARFGLDQVPEPHVGENRPGLVGLWKPVTDITDEDGEADGEGGWLSRPDRKLADRIARQVRQWMDHGFPLAKGGMRNAGPGDVMVLVRKRKELAGLIVARLHAAGVPVAGVDRLRLGAPLAVKDLMAALRFAAQPFDDLNLANLLVSPLVGWSQQQLLDHGWRPDNGAKGGRISLWDHLRASSDDRVVALRQQLGDLLALADYEPPQQMLHWILVGPWQGRRKLVARLGREANDPIDELINSAHNFSSAHVPGLQGFIRWFDVGDGELKREAGASDGLVRVMTVHGSKGLQSPIVILADAAGDPDSSPVRGLELTEDLPGGEGRTIPLPSLRKEETLGPIALAEAAAMREEREEHWRLLYVAMTRAEEALFIGGSLGPRDKGVPADDSWYAQLAPLFTPEAIVDAIWGERREIGSLGPAVVDRNASARADRPALPDWVLRPIGPEPRPPRPLAPSAAGEVFAADPPLAPGTAMDAARRGVLIHKLLERLPDLPQAAREPAALAWLAREAGDLALPMRSEMAASAMAVLGMADWAELFSPSALAEVPLAAKVGGQVIAGTADRLLVTDTRVLVVDFKTARRPPASLDAIPRATLRQMAAYVAALEAIYPGHEVDAAVLYTQIPQLIALPRQIVDRHKQALEPAQ